MKKLLLIVCYLFCQQLSAQEFSFALVTDTHIGSANGLAEEDLRRTVHDINSQKEIEFVVVTGDITEMGTQKEILLAKELLDQLQVPYYVTPGNHDTGWSESGGVDFIKAFGYDKFAFEHKGYKIIGTASGPYVRMSDGHIPRDAVVWLDSVLASTPADQPIINANHYPLDASLDNWYELTDRLRKFNTQFSLCGHGHTNKSYDFDGIPGIMGRSNLRAKKEFGGYTLVQITKDSAFFYEKNPGLLLTQPWKQVPLGLKNYDSTQQFPRPDYAINAKSPQIKAKWTFHSPANVVSTPLVKDDLVIFGNSLGKIEALSKESGKEVWSFQTGAGIFSSPVDFEELLILGSGDGKIYGLKRGTGELVWDFQTGAAVLGSPAVAGQTVFIGGSDGKFRALNARNGKLIWEFGGIQGAVVSTPLLTGDKVILGAWDRHLYSLNQQTGELIWKWDNGSPNRMFSPAMCTPVAHEGIVYIAAPDRVLTAIDLESGENLWRNNEATVRESIGISENGKWIYGKTMQDELVAFSTGKDHKPISWRVNCGFGYEHTPSMLIEREGKIYFGTKNSTVYCVDAASQQVDWAYKTDNSMANTVRYIDEHQLLVATMDGKITLLEF